MLLNTKQIDGLIFMPIDKRSIPFRTMIGVQSYAALNVPIIDDLKKSIVEASWVNPHQQESASDSLFDDSEVTDEPKTKYRKKKRRRAGTFAMSISSKSIVRQSALPWAGAFGLFR